MFKETLRILYFFEYFSRFDIKKNDVFLSPHIFCNTKLMSILRIILIGPLGYSSKLEFKNAPFQLTVPLQVLCHQ